MAHRCLVCGYSNLEHPPRGSEGGGSYEICPSCGFQFGVDDDDRRVSVAAWRKRWIEGGMKWASRGTPPPAGWDPARQMRALQGESRRRAS